MKIQSFWKRWSFAQITTMPYVFRAENPLHIVALKLPHRGPFVHRLNIKRDLSLDYGIARNTKPIDFIVLCPLNARYPIYVCSFGAGEGRDCLWVIHEIKLLIKIQEPWTVVRCVFICCSCCWWCCQQNKDLIIYYWRYMCVAIVCFIL